MTTGCRHTPEGEPHAAVCRLANDDHAAKLALRRISGAGAWEPRLGDPAEGIFCFGPGGRRACPGRSRL